MGFRKLLLGSLALTSIVSVADRAAAQEAESGSAFGDIVVTAQKRDENLQDVPVSVSAFTAEFRDQTGIISTQDQMNFTPGVVYSASADRVAIRGVGRQTNSIGTDPGIAVYNDGFYQPSLTDLGDSTLGTQRIEVLRGPQGTLYGRNSIGGAINVISRRPSDEFEGEVRAGFNDYGRTTFEGRVSGPLSFNSRGSLQLYKADQEEGYYDNQFPGAPDEGGVVDTWYAEGQWAVDVTDRFDMWFRLRAAEYDNRDRSGTMVSQYDYGYSLENVPTPTWDLGQPGSMLSNPSMTDNRAFLSDRSRSNYLEDYFLFVTEMNYRFDDFSVRYIGGWQQYATGWTVDGEQGPSEGFEWPLSNDWYDNVFDDDDDMVFNPLTGYLVLGELSPGEDSGQTIDVTGDVETLGSDDKDVFSHEINFSSTHDGPLQWLVGLYYYQEQNAQDFHITFPTESVFDEVYPLLTNPVVLAGAGAPAASVYGTAYLVMTGAIPATAMANPLRTGYSQAGSLEARSSAAFAQFDYDFSDTLHATFGIRYSHDEKEGVESTRIPAWYAFVIPDGTPLDVTGDGVADFNLAGGDMPVSYVSDISALTFVDSTTQLYSAPRIGVHDNSWNHMSGTAGLQWTPNDDMMFYASYSHGYKSGGFTLGPFKPDVDSETIDAIEVGWKLELSPTLQFNGALFHYNYHDLQTVIQTPVVGGATSQLINLNESRTRGLELEGLWAPTENLRIMANYSYNDAEILTACCFLDDAEPFIGAQDLAGNRVPFSPEHKAAINATYTMFFEPGELSFSATMNYRSESYYTVFNTNNWFMDGYTTTDLRVRWSDSEDRYAIIGTVVNATDEDAVQAASTSNPQTSNQRTIGLQAPRIYAVEFQYRF